MRFWRTVLDDFWAVFSKSFSGHVSRDRGCVWEGFMEAVRGVKEADEKPIQSQHNLSKAYTPYQHPSHFPGGCIDTRESSFVSRTLTLK